jgi:hypothetical protein
MKNELLGKLQPYQGKVVKVTEYQQTGDIIAELIKGHNKYASEYDKISPKFWKGSVRSSCQYVWNFLKNNVRYKVEPDTRQSVKSPAAILATGKNGGYNDCKHYSSFFGGLLDSWKRSGKYIDWCYRFANYKLFGTQPHHVFVVVNPGGEEIWCDAVLDKFDWHKPYMNKIDKKVNTNKMALYQISGIGCNDYGCKCNSGGMYGFEDFGQPQISGRKERRAVRRSGEHCKGRTVPKFAPPVILARKAFLLLVRINFRKLGVKIHYALQNPTTRAKVLEKWCSLGGNADLLKSTVEKAWKKYSRQHNISSVGFTGVELAAAWASAQPIILAMLPIIALAAKLAPSGSKAKEVLETVSETAEQVKEVTSTDDTGSGGGQTTSGNTNAWIYGGLALAGVYLLTRKKRK